MTLDLEREYNVTSLGPLTFDLEREYNVTSLGLSTFDLYLIKTGEVK